MAEKDLYFTLMVCLREMWLYRGLRKRSPLKALRYAFILRKRHGAIIPKGVYGKLMADVKASKPESAPAEVESTAQESAPAEVESTAQESAPAQAESAPKKKGARKSAPRKRTAKKANTEPNTESK